MSKFFEVTVEVVVVTLKNTKTKGQRNLLSRTIGYWGSFELFLILNKVVFRLIIK